jgi:hypothetical protein
MDISELIDLQEILYSDKRPKTIIRIVKDYLINSVDKSKASAEELTMLRWS